MLKFFKILVASLTLAFIATPATAQDEEEPRTTYSVTFLKFTPGSDGRWMEIMQEYAIPAREAAGQSPATVHWIMANDAFDVMIINEMVDGMAGFDSHANPQRAAFMAALTDIVGSEEALEELGSEFDTLIEREVTYYTHTHP